jgi:hypothetical protein
MHRRLAGLFRGRDRRRRDLYRLGQLRTADRDRCRGRLRPQHRGVPAAGPGRRHGGARVSDAAGRRHRPTGSRELRRRPVLGRSGHLCRRTARTSFYGFFYNVEREVAGLVQPENFEDAGYEIPETMEELKALTEQIVADGETPWCIGLGSGAATGWPATDWVEDMMLRTQPPEVYDAWVSNEIPFNDPRIVAAIESSAFARNDDYVAGGAGRRGHHRLPRQPQGPLRLAAAVLHAPPGVVHPGLLPRRHRRWARTWTSSTSRPMRERKGSGQPGAGRGTLLAITNDSPDAPWLIEFLQTPPRMRSGWRRAAS